MSATEFARALELSGVGLAPGKEQALFAAADKDGDDLLTIDEFLAPRAVPELLSRLPGQPQHVIPLYEPNARRIWSSFRGRRS